MKKLGGAWDISLVITSESSLWTEVERGEDWLRKAVSIYCIERTYMYIYV